MKNPFFILSDDGKHKYIDSSCSLNKMVIAKSPKKGIDDSIEGKSVSEILSTSAIIKTVDENREKLNISSDISNKKLPFVLLDSMESENETVKNCATEIAVKYGKRLGLILLTLKTALPENRAVRPEWKDEHWKYWNNIENVIAVGGLTSGKFGEVIISEAKKVCTINEEPAYNIIAFENAAYVGVLGCAKLIEKTDGINVLMDFGQTNMKRSIVARKNKEIQYIKNLPIVSSKYMQWDIYDNNEKLKQAKLLHKHIINVTCDTIKEAEKMGNVDNQIVISIASYVHNGILDSNRGGYAKLTMLYKNYGEYLSEELSSVLKRPVNVTLVHDGTAVALNFSDYINSVCITLGTFFGVGFTDIFN